MRVIDCVQGEPSWVQARLGVVTASGFDKLLTPAKLQLSASHLEYMDRLVAETILGRPLEELSSAFMDRGKEMEEDARNWYAYKHHVDCVRVGFIVRDDGLYGCSPDSLIDEDGGAEFKCPAAHTHAGYYRDPSSLAAAYRGQVQNCLGVTGRKWWDLCSFNPKMPKVVVRVLPDPLYQEAVAKVLDGPDGFIAKVQKEVARMRAAIEAEFQSNPFL